MRVGLLSARLATSARYDMAISTGKHTTLH